MPGVELTYPSEVLSVIEQVLEIDRSVYGELSARDNQPAFFWLERWLYRPDMNFVCFAGDEVVGNLQIVPLADGVRRQIGNGALGDGELVDEHIRPAGVGCDGLYVMSIVVAPAMQGQGIARRMWDAALAYWLSYGSPVRGLATLWSGDGQRFFARYRDGVLGADPAGHPIWSLELRQAERSSRNEEGRAPARIPFSGTIFSP